MIIAQMTDIHIGFDPEARPEELNRQRFRATLDRLLKQPNLLDMLVCSGDITDRGDADSFAKTAELLADLPFPVHVMVGNHDSRDGLLAAFPETLRGDDGFIHAAFERDGLLVVLLDTLEPGRHGGAFCTARRDWLRGVLEANRHVPTVVFMHHPPVVSGIAWMGPREDEAWIANLAAAFNGMDQVQADPLRPLAPPDRDQLLRYPAQRHALGRVAGVTRLAPDLPRKVRCAGPHHHRTTRQCTAGTARGWSREKVSDWDVLAYYGPHLQTMIREMDRENLEG